MEPTKRWIYLQNRKRLTDLENTIVVAGEKDGGMDSYAGWDVHVHIAIFQMDK